MPSLTKGENGISKTQQGQGFGFEDVRIVVPFGFQTQKRAAPIKEAALQIFATKAWLLFRNQMQLFVLIFKPHFFFL